MKFLEDFYSMATALRTRTIFDSPTFSSGRHQFFLLKIKQDLHLESLYDAKEIAEIVYRVMRDLMNHETINQVASELEAPAIQSDKERLDSRISDLWQDNNPLVSWLSRLRPAFDTEGFLGMNDTVFLKRIRQEGALPAHVAPLAAINSVFAATKDELTPEMQAKVETCLPGIVQTAWQNADSNHKTA